MQSSFSWKRTQRSGTTPPFKAFGSIRFLQNTMKLSCPGSQKHCSLRPAKPFSPGWEATSQPYLRRPAALGLDSQPRETAQRRGPAGRYLRWRIRISYLLGGKIPVYHALFCNNSPSGNAGLPAAEPFELPSRDSAHAAYGHGKNPLACPCASSAFGAASVRVPIPAVCAKSA